MRVLLIIVGTALLCELTPMFAQGHIAPCNGSSDHTGGICYGYAIGRAAGRFAGDSNCDPLTFYQSTINTNFFTFFSDASLAGLQAGDIVRFADHAAYVTSVGSPVGESRVDQYSTLRLREETNLRLEDVKQEFGDWSGYYRKKPVPVTVQNSFSGGVVRINGSNLSTGTYQLNWWYLHTLEAVDKQNILDPNNNTYYVRVFREWSTPDGPRTSISISITPRPGEIYTANFKKEFNITFQNNLAGANGGQIKVEGSTHAAPYVAHTLEQNPPQGITGEALYQVISGIEYTFSSWSPGGSTSASTTFTPGDHTTYTANFNAKPLPPPNVSAGGPVGSYVQLSWNEHPHSSVSQYQIWRKVKPPGQQEGPPQLLTTVNRGITSFTDFEYIVTDGYTHALLWYDVRAYFSVNGSYSDPNWVSAFGRQDNRLSDNVKQPSSINESVPTEYSLSTYPNPFNPTTTLRYQLAEDAFVTLTIADVLGRVITTLVQTEESAGSHAVQWNGRDARDKPVASGVYLYRFTAIPLSGKQPVSFSGKLLLSK